VFFSMRFLLGIVIAYLIGSINPAIIVSSRFYGSDIREHGSGNAGMTNAFRVMGFKRGFVVMICDLLKGVIAALAGWLIAGSLEGKLVAVVLIVLGHCFPVFYGFKGGKGVLVTAGAILVLDWRMALSAIALFLIVLFIFKMVSLGSIVAALSLPFWAWLYNNSAAFIAVGAIVALILVFMHRSNIKRIISATEPKVGRKKEAGGQ
jgi:glycerol-3-phosphate acyltransferase PlsY